MHRSNSIRSLWLGFVATGVLALAAGHAQASEEFPGALQEAAGIPCTPSCTVCHGKTPGDLASFTARALPRALIAQGVAPAAHDTNFVKNAYAAYAAKAATDPAIAAVVAALKEGKDPETGDSLCGPSYGCGAHVAKKAPPADLAAPLWVVGAMLTGGLLRRRRGKRAV